MKATEVEQIAKIVNSCLDMAYDSTLSDFQQKSFMQALEIIQNQFSETQWSVIQDCAVELTNK